MSDTEWKLSGSVGSELPEGEFESVIASPDWDVLAYNSP